MKLTFLGTGGSEGYPALFCNCPRCCTARRLSGRSVRRRSSLLVNDDLLIDLGPDVPSAAQQLGIGLHNVRHVLITHLHDDHFLPITLRYRTRRKGIDPPLLTVYGSQPTIAKLATIPFSFDDIRIQAQVVQAGQCFQAGGYSIVAIPANHAPDVEPLLYAVFEDGPGVLYATDTAAFLEQTWQALTPLRLQAAVLNCAMGERSDSDEDRLHMTRQETVDHAARLRERGILISGGIALGIHFSHRSQPDHDTLRALLMPEGIVPAYDGLQLDLQSTTFARR